MLTCLPAKQTCWLCQQLWANAKKGPGSCGFPADGHGLPTLLDPFQAREHHEPGPPPSFEPEGRDPSPRPPDWGFSHHEPLRKGGEGGRGQGVLARDGVPAHVFSDCGRYGRGSATSRVEPGPASAEYIGLRLLMSLHLAVL